jgi:uncharacterized membrane protein YtjA (UPF0391 family)
MRAATYLLMRKHAVTHEHDREGEEGPTPLHWSGFFFALALVCAAWGLGSRSEADEVARLLFFVFLVLGIAPLLWSASHETS